MGAMTTSHQKDNFLIFSKIEVFCVHVVSHIKHIYREFFTSHINFSNRDGQPLLFIFILFASSALLLIANIVENKSGAYKENGAIKVADEHSISHLNFKDFILDLPGSQMRESYKYTLQNLVLENPEALGDLTLKDMASLFHDIRLAKSIGDSHMWQFSSDICVVDIYFVYKHGDELMSRSIEYVDIRQKNKKNTHKINLQTHKSQDAQCLKSIMDQSKPRQKTAFMLSSDNQG